MAFPTLPYILLPEAGAATKGRRLIETLRHDCCLVAVNRHGNSHLEGIMCRSAQFVRAGMSAECEPASVVRSAQLAN